MGAWGVLAFDNDTANDWAYDLEDLNDLSLVEAALANVEAVGTDDYLDQDDACCALAGCEILSRLRGKAGYTNSYTEKVDEWVASHPLVPPPDLLIRAGKVIDRILGKNSELRILWEEGDATDWLASVEDLRLRMRG
jgi:hypothetical protein